jgi:hypothetical protein
MEEIRRHCLMIESEASILESISRDPKVTIEDIEAKANSVKEELEFLHETIHRYRVKKEAKLHQSEQAQVPER